MPTNLDAEKSRDAAIAQADANAHDQWKRYALDFVAEVSTVLDDFTTDDLWDLGLIKPNEPRALGPVMRRAAKRGLIATTGEFRKSRYRNCAPLPVWASV
ncbi:hypothetical protein JHN50_04325 [Streptomyces sp. MBT98]|uniref:hypothetical protein n=1 Tax=unclassified Streptomyces TaxID=2593676 RepID=UPI00190AE9F1|nr:MULTISPECIES: hypothetical protein [unclassified Streptomyces]MBK3601004.1 hypothetical protein [Streptomyces sp. MBT54]MBK3613910.1 hypothetical protein [Streptomyces sp. MBT98]MBK6042025.1 hypothetical protein [Streptomyces sp. MBT55]